MNETEPASSRAAELAERWMRLFNLHDVDGLAAFAGEVGDSAFGEEAIFAGFVEGAGGDAEGFGEIGVFFAEAVEGDGADEFSKGVGLDEDFVLDRRGPIIVCSACSGHGAKFAPWV